MIKYRDKLPQLAGKPFISDGGLETTLIFHNGMELPEFAAFDLLKDKPGSDTLADYFATYIKIASDNSVGFLLESPTWRANIDWGQKLGYSQADLDQYNRKSIELMSSLRDEYETANTPIVISGCIGPQGDGYSPDRMMSAEEAEQYHLPQVTAFANTDADLVSAYTMTYAEETIGITRAAQKNNIPVVISFTVETDGKLPSGQRLGDAITQVDKATDNGPVYYMINCAHPTHFEKELESGQPWVNRIQGIKANASCKSHAELDEAEELDDGNPEEFGGQYKALTNSLGHINILGGCCGTDHRHIEEIVKRVCSSEAGK